MYPFPDDKTLQRLARTIENTSPRPHHSTLSIVLTNLISDVTFHHVLSVGGWYHSGGVLDADGNFLSRDLESWLDKELAKYKNNLKQFVEQYAEAGLLVTRHSGHTHYFTASYGEAPEDFLQLEVEELHEVLDRQLIDPEQPPEDRMDLTEPDHYIKIDAQPVASPRYRFVRLVDVRQVLARQSAPPGMSSPLARFMGEWSASRAAGQGHFCKHWVITGLDQYKPSETTTFTATPVSVHKYSLKPFQWDMGKVGADLSIQIQDFDRVAGYPGAWYFHFVTGKLVPENLGATLRKDLDNGYHYLAERDLELFNKLEANPYRLG